MTIIVGHLNKGTFVFTFIKSLKLTNWGHKLNYNTYFKTSPIELKYKSLFISKGKQT